MAYKDFMLSAEGIARIRESGFTHPELARAVDCTPRTIARYIARQSRMSTGDVERLAECLRCGVEQLVAVESSSRSADALDALEPSKQLSTTLEQGTSGALAKRFAAARDLLGGHFSYYLSFVHLRAWPFRGRTARAWRPGHLRHRYAEFEIVFGANRPTTVDVYWTGDFLPLLFRYGEMRIDGSSVRLRELFNSNRDSANVVDECIRLWTWCSPEADRFIVTADGDFEMTVDGDDSSRIRYDSDRTDVVCCRPIPHHIRRAAEAGVLFDPASDEGAQL